MRNFDTDVVIIGSGLGGLASAILLGEQGFTTTIIERSPLPGGLLRSYARQGVDCPVGLHYFGPAGEGELLRQMFDILGVTDELKLRRLGTGGILERYIFDDLIFDLPPGLSAFEQSLCEMCPGDQDAIRTVVASVGDVSGGLRFDATGRLQSNSFSFAGYNQSLQGFLVASGCSKKLQDILSVHGFWSGLPMDTCPAYLILYTLGALLQSAWELGCTGTHMVGALVERSRQCGCEFILGDPVEAITVRDGCACGVRLKSGAGISCRKIIAGIHPKLVLGMLPDDAVPDTYRRGLLNLRETPGVISVRLLADAGRLTVPGYHLFRINRIGRANMDGAFFQIKPSGLAGRTVLTIMHGSDYNDWKQWHHTRTGMRGELYEKKKKAIAGSMIEAARSVLGDFGDYELLDVSTPLSMRDWAASPEGSVYGLARSVTTDMQYAVLTRFPVRALYLAGQNAIAPGVLGVMLSVLRGVGEVVGRSHLRDFIARRLAS